MTNSVTFPASIGGDGLTYTDDDNPSTGLANGGAVVRFLPLVSNVVAAANYMATQAEGCSQSVSTTASSTTSLTISTGSKSLTLAQTGKAFAIGQTVNIADSTGLNVMAGTITAYNSATGAMTVNATNTAGSGTYSAWTISVGGFIGSASLFQAVLTFNSKTLTANSNVVIPAAATIFQAINSGAL